MLEHEFLVSEQLKWEGGESDFLLVNLFSPLCPGRSPPLLCVSRARFPPRSFFSLGSFRPLAMEQLRNLLRGSAPNPSPFPAKPGVWGFFLCLFFFSPFLHLSAVRKPNQKIRNYFLLELHRKIPSRQNHPTALQSFPSAAGKSHLGFF